MKALAVQAQQPRIHINVNGGNNSTQSSTDVTPLPAKTKIEKFKEYFSYLVLTLYMPHP